MNTLDHIVTKYGLNVNQKQLPIEIPNTTRDDLASLFCELGYKVGAEIGVERGVYSEVLCKANPQAKLYSIDAWKAYKGYREHVTQEKIDQLHDSAVSRLEPYNCQLVKGFSVDVSKTFDDGSLDFVYIDGNHEYTHVVNDIASWDRKVRPGGIVAGHDYILRKTNGYLMHVPYAVQGFTASYNIRPFFVLGRKHAPGGEARESSRSWFYVKR